MSLSREIFERDGVTLAFYRSEESGPTVVFQHGLCGDHMQPHDVFAQDDGFCHVVMDARGHGHSEPGSYDAFSIQTFASDLSAYLEEKDLFPCVIGGISMGAAIALHIAHYRPDLISGLILARPAWLFDIAPVNMLPNAYVGQLLLDHGAQEARAIFEKSDIAQDLREHAPDNLASLTGFFDREPVEVTGELLTRISNDGPGVSRQSVQEITVPSLVIGTDADSIHPFEYAQTLADTLPNSNLVKVTSKSDNKAAYTHEFKDALRIFLKENFKSG